MTNTETYAKISKSITHEARRWARAWPHVAADDFVQHGWLVVLEALPSYDPTRSKVQTFVSRVCARAFLNFAWQQTLPVHAPQKNEHKFAHVAQAASAKVSREAIAAQQAKLDVDDTIDQAYTREAVRDAVDAVAREFAVRLARLKQHRSEQAIEANTSALAALLLSETTAATLEAETGTKASRWYQRSGEARAELRLRLGDYRGQA